MSDSDAVHAILSCAAGTYTVQSSLSVVRVAPVKAVAAAVLAGDEKDRKVGKGGLRKVSNGNRAAQN